MHGEQAVFKFRGVDTISDAERLAGAEIAIPAEQRGEIAADEYYQSDLLGCEVWAPDGRRLGIVTGWQETGGPLVIEVETPEKKELLIPFAKSIFTRIDVAARRIEVVLPEGLENLN
jgi:16S rRNA processing protein RimM